MKSEEEKVSENTGSMGWGNGGASGMKKSPPKLCVTSDGMGLVWCHVGPGLREGLPRAREEA